MPDNSGWVLLAEEIDLEAFYAFELQLAIAGTVHWLLLHCVTGWCVKNVRGSKHEKQQGPLVSGHAMRIPVGTLLTINSRSQSFGGLNSLFLYWTFIYSNPRVLLRTR
jgi:hypothetical protein